jgi:hypothetical protein
VEAGSPRPGYGVTAAFGAVLATLLFPLPALIAALVMLRGQTDPAKRSFLRTWAWASGIWLLVPLILIVLAST